MICINRDVCNSVSCTHKEQHLANAFCEPGHCKWGDTRCIPETKREQLAELMMTDEWGHLTDASAIDAIMEIFGEEEGTR